MPETETTDMSIWDRLCEECEGNGCGRCNDRGFFEGPPHPADCYPCKGTGFVVGFGAKPGAYLCPADYITDPDTDPRTY